MIEVLNRIICECEQYLINLENDNCSLKNCADYINTYSIMNKFKHDLEVEKERNKKEVNDDNITHEE